MRKYLPLIVIFIFNFTIVFGQDYYRSNSIGMVFEKIPSFRINDFDWVLKLSRVGNLETRSIYFEGKEKRRIEYLRESGVLTISEYVSDTLVHVEHHKNGLVVNEKYFKGDKLLDEYIYQWSSGRQLQKTTYMENGETVYTDTFITDANGRLKQERRLYAEGKMRIAGFSYSSQGLLDGWYGSDKDFLLYKYHNGKVVGIENWKNGIISSTKKIAFADSGSTETETDLIKGIVIVRLFDSSDKILSEETRDGNKVQKSTYIYKKNLLIQKDISSSGLREKHLYEYYGDNSIYLEKIFRNDMLIKEIFFKFGKEDIVKLYRDDSLVLIVSYKNGEKISEEQIR